MIVATSSPKKWLIGAEIIKWYQKTTFSHILIIQDDLVFQASHGYVNCCHIDVFLEHNDIVTFFEVPDSAVDMDYVKHQLGKEYGQDQIWKISLYVLTRIKLNGNGDKRFICSELIGRALMLDWVDDYTNPLELDIYLRKISGDK